MQEGELREVLPHSDLTRDEDTAAAALRDTSAPFLREERGAATQGQ